MKKLAVILFAPGADLVKNHFFTSNLVFTELMHSHQSLKLMVLWCFSRQFLAGQVTPV